LSSFWNLINIDWIIMRSKCNVVSIWGIRKTFTPFSWFIECCNSFCKIIIIKNMNITVIVAYCNVVMSWWICNGSCLLLNRELTKSWSCWLYLLSFVCFSTQKIKWPNFSLLNQLFCFDIVFIDYIVISTSQECTLIFNNLKSPRFTITVRCLNDLFVSTISIYCLNFSIIMTDQNLPV